MFFITISKTKIIIIIKFHRYFRALVRFDKRYDLVFDYVLMCPNGTNDENFKLLCVRLIIVRGRGKSDDDRVAETRKKIISLKATRTLIILFFKNGKVGLYLLCLFFLYI